MWKIIIIIAVLLILGGTFVFNKNQKAMVMDGGEVTTVRELRDEVVNTVRNTKRNEIVRTYAQLRQEHFADKKKGYNQEKDEFDKERSQTETEIADTEEKTRQTQEQLDELKLALKSAEDALNQARGEVQTITQSGGDADSSTFDFDAVTQAVTDLMLKNEELRVAIDKEDRTIAALNEETDRRAAHKKELEDLNRDRQARLSPAELECTVNYVDPNWGFVRLNAGINKGIVIGSRLAVMRGDVKICEINVTNVETRAAAGEVVRDTLMPAECVKPGDRVIAVRNNP